MTRMEVKLEVEMGMNNVNMLLVKKKYTLLTYYF